MSSPTEKNVYDQAIKSDRKQYREIGKFATGHGEDCTTSCLLDYDSSGKWSYLGQSKNPKI